MVIDTLIFVIFGFIAFTHLNEIKMKKSLLLSGIMLAIARVQVSAQTQAPAPTIKYNRCGMQAYRNELIAEDPSWAAKFEAQRNSLQAAADYYMQQQKSGALERTTSTISAVPIIFHIVVDSAQFNTLGGTAGIIARCDSQIAVLNRDFNMQNPDSGSIPSSWKPLYGNVGVNFGLARVDPSGNCSPGYEVKIITATGFSSIDSAKSASTGLAAWDATKYYNVWCINYTGGLNGLLGITAPKSSSSLTHEGVCILYNTLGCTAQDGTPPANTGGTAGWVYPYNLGRTLTHETGHFFEIWHPWGDDGGQCPTWSSTATATGTSLSSAGGDNGVTCTSGVGNDDGLSDTPPESDAVYGNPTYNITGGTTFDCCQMNGSVNTQPMGIACLSYMDYTDDDAMHMFTTMQAAAMASMVLVSTPGGTGATGTGTIGENYNLTQNPSLLVACTSTGVAPSPTELKSSLSIYPNPTNGEINVTINSAVETLNEIVVINLVGQQVMTVKGQNKDYYSIDLSGMSKGIYFVKCNFASGSVTRKILLQ